MTNEEIKRYGYFNALKEDKRRKVNIEHIIKNYSELNKIIKMSKNMTKNKEIAEIRIKIEIDYYIE